MSIEKNIWQTYETSFDALPDYAKESVGTWTYQNPEWTHGYMSGQDREDFFKEHFDSKTNKLVNSCCCRNCSLVSSSTRIIPIKLPMPISNCSIREKIGSRNSASHRVSFPCSNFSSMNSSTFNSSISSSSSTSSASTTPSLSSTASSSLIQHQQQQVDGQFKLLKISKQNG